MKRLLRVLLCLSVLPLVAGAAERFDRTKARIDTLLARRLNPEALPPKIANPFETTGTAAGGAVRGGTPDTTPPGDRTPAPTPDAAPPSDNAGILAFYARTLRISGHVLLGGRDHLIINQSPYKEGDLILLRGKEASVYLRVEKITASELTLSYNDATLDVPLKN